MKNLLLLFIFFTACSDKNTTNISGNNESENIDTIDSTISNNPYFENYENKKEMQKLLKNAIQKGDTLSYQETFKNFSISGNLQNFLYYSLKMGKNHNYRGAYFDTYYILNLLNNQNGFSTQKDKNEALFYLVKSYEMGDPNAKSKVNELFLKQKIKAPSSKSLLKN